MEPRTLKGFRDYLPAIEAPRKAMIRVIEATFERHGFVPLQTPALEYLETLAGKYGDEGDKLLYRFADHGARDVALRYDLTVPLARVVAQHRGELQLPLRRYQVAPVWRADKPQRGRFREFVQCDADIAGVDSALADAEVLVAGLAVLDALGIADARLHLNHRSVLFGLLRVAGVREPALQVACVRALDKLDKLPPAAVQAEMEGHGVASATAAGVLARFTVDRPTLADLGDALRDDATPDGPAGTDAGARLRRVVELVTAAGHGDRLVFDPTIARGLDYYTGLIYETRLTDPRVAGIGAVMSGGRYDGLVGLFSKEPVPAVGISLGLDRLLAALVELGLAASGAAQVPVYVTVFDAASATASVRLAAHLRAAGLRVEVDAAGGKLGKQLERASKRGALVAAILGPDEAEVGIVVLKDLRRGVQDKVAIPVAHQWIQKAIDGAN